MLHGQDGAATYNRMMTKMIEPPSTSPTTSDLEVSGMNCALRGACGEGGDSLPGVENLR